MLPRFLGLTSISRLSLSRTLKRPEARSNAPRTPCCPLIIARMIIVVAGIDALQVLRLDANILAGVQPHVVPLPLKGANCVVCVCFVSRAFIEPRGAHMVGALTSEHLTQSVKAVNRVLVLIFAELSSWNTGLNDPSSTPPRAAYALLAVEVSGARTAQPRHSHPGRSAGFCRPPGPPRPPTLEHTCAHLSTDADE